MTGTPDQDTTRPAAARRVETGPGSEPTLADVQREFPGWTCLPSRRACGGYLAIRTQDPEHPVPEQYAQTEAGSPADLRQRLATAEAALTRAHTRATSTSGEPMLASIEQEFGWTCWQRNGLYYARRQHAPRGDYDAQGDDPADLREAIIIAQYYGGRDDPAARQTMPAPARTEHRRPGRLS